MSIQLLEILKNSALSSVISSQEIVDIAEELKTEIEDYMETKIEEKEDEIAGLEEEKADLEKDIARLENRVENLEWEIKEIKKETPSLQDHLVQEWVDENWETFRNIYLSGEKLKNQITQSQRSSDKNHKRVILVGKAASGKDYARKMLQSKGFSYAVSYTTRPPREGEIDGEDYFFKSVEEFQSMIEAGEFYEHVVFNNWYYGTTVKQFYEDDVFIMTPYGVSKLKQDDRKKTWIIFFDIEESVRKERLSVRSDADTVERRLKADEQDFENFTDFDLRITNHNF
jgi:guanylate kinase